MTSPLSKLRTYNRPTNGLAWVREAERLLAEAYERPVDAATRVDASSESSGSVVLSPRGASLFGTPPELIPEGATEFVSDGFRALRYMSDSGLMWQVRVRVLDNGVRFEHREAYTAERPTLWRVATDTTHESYINPSKPWVMHWLPRADEPIEAAPEQPSPASKDSLTAEAGDALEILNHIAGNFSSNPREDAHTAASHLLSERLRTAAEIERLRARVGELETANERMESELRAGMPKGKPGRHWAVKNPGSADHFKGLAHAAVVALGRTNEDLAPVDITESITSLQSERDAAIREREEARAKAVPGWSQHRDNSDEYVASCLGCGAELTDDEEHAWTDCVKFARESHSVDVEVQAARISELESQLAEVRGMYEGLRGGLVETMTQVGSGSETYEVLHEAITRFPALPPTESDYGPHGCAVQPAETTKENHS